MPHQWKPEEDEWIRINYTKGRSRSEIAKEFEAEFGDIPSLGALSTRAYDLGLRGVICPKITKEESDFLWENGPKMRRADLTKLFNEKFGCNRNVGAIVALCVKRKIPSMNVPPTKGRKFPRYPIGAESLDGTKDGGYVIVKVADTGVRSKDWVPKHRYIWEKAYGKIPEGYIISFLDNDRMNFQLDNLCLMTRKESAIMAKLGWNQICDPELKKAALSACRLQISLRDHGVNSRQCQDRQFGTS